MRVMRVRTFHIRVSQKVGKSLDLFLIRTCTLESAMNAAKRAASKVYPRQYKADGLTFVSI
jgi:hypothetical protein